MGNNKRLGLRRQPRVLLHRETSRSTPWEDSGLDILFDAWASLQQENADWENPTNHDVVIRQTNDSTAALPGGRKATHQREILFVSPPPPMVPSDITRSKVERYELEPMGPEYSEILSLIRMGMGNDTAKGLPTSSEWQGRQDGVRPILRSGDGIHVFHSMQRQQNGLRQVLFIPDRLVNSPSTTYRAWILAALRLFRAFDDGPVLASVPPLWNEEDWYPRHARAVATRIHEAEVELAAHIEQSESTIAGLRSELSNLLSTRGQSHQALLETQSDALEKATKAAFEQLGFEVQIPEEESTNQKAEDLLLSHSDWPGWTASVEVKGWRSRGPKQAEITKLGRRAAKRSVTGAVFIANCEFAKPPPSRRPPLGGHPEAIENTQAAQVLVIDTRHLYQAVEHGHRADELLAAIRNDVGVYGFADEPGTWDTGGDTSWLSPREE